MKYARVFSPLVLALVAGLAAPAGAATTISGISNGSTYLHAGPGDDFPVVAHVPPGENLDLSGCAQDASWCDVAWNGNHGWIAGRFIDTILHDEHVGLVEYRSVISVPVETFDQNIYWRDHYVTYPFYSVTRYWTKPAENPVEVRSDRYVGVDE